MFNPDFSLKNTYIQIYTGDGKGKTTASIGLTLRHLGQGGSVLYAQFCKGDKDAFPSGEKRFCEEYAKRFNGKFTFRNFGSKYKWETPSNIDNEDREQFIRDYSFVFMCCQNYTLVVLDEISHALKCKLISVPQLNLLIEKCKNHSELVFTGRDFPDELLNKAHLVTTMQPTKHYWDIGVIARQGIEY